MKAPALNPTASAYVHGMTNRSARFISSGGRGIAGGRKFAGRGLSYEGTTENRQTDDWVVAPTDPTELTSTWLAMLQQRSRSLARKSPAFIAAIQALVDLVVDPIHGVRIRSKAYTDDAGEKLNEDFINQVRGLWDEQTEGADIDGRESFASMIRLAVREWFEVGEAFVLEMIDEDADRPVPITWKIIPAERIDHTLEQARGTKNGVTQNRITNGIEFDANDKRVAYHVTKVDDRGLPTFETERIDASRIRHLFVRSRAGQERGLPWLYGATLLCHDLEDLIGDELTSAHVSAQIAAYIETEDPEVFGEEPEGFTTETDSATGRRLKRIQAGTLMALKKGEKVHSHIPNRPGGTFIPFASFILRCIGKTIGISYERLTGDFTQVNFASGRLGGLAERETVRRIQADLIQLVVRPSWKSFIRVGIAFGKIAGVALVDFLKNVRRYTKATYTGKGFEYHDVLKEVTAALVAVSGSTSTLEHECLMRNMDWREVIDQRAIEIAYMKGKGVPIVMIGGAQVVTGQGDGNGGFEQAPPPEDGDRKPGEGKPNGDRSSSQKALSAADQFVIVPMSDLTRLMELTREEQPVAATPGTPGTNGKGNDGTH